MIWRIFTITWFDLIRRPFPWFDLIRICKIKSGRVFDSNHGFRQTQWHRWKELAETFRSVPYLSMKPYFYLFNAWSLVTPKIWFEIEIKSWLIILIWFGPEIWPHDLIWFDDSQKHQWFDLRKSRYWSDLIWMLPTPGH